MSTRTNLQVLVLGAQSSKIVADSAFYKQSVMYDHKSINSVTANACGYGEEWLTD